VPALLFPVPPCPQIPQSQRQGREKFAHNLSQQYLPQRQLAAVLAGIDHADAGDELSECLSRPPGQQDGIGEVEYDFQQVDVRKDVRPGSESPAERIEDQKADAGEKKSIQQSSPDPNPEAGKRIAGLLGGILASGRLGSCEALDKRGPCGGISGEQGFGKISFRRRLVPHGGHLH